MPFLEIGSEGALNGTTAVDVVISPAASTRRLVRNIGFVNRDTVAQTIVLYKNKGGTQYELGRSESLAANAGWTYEKLVVLDATDEKVQAVQLAAVTTTAPSYDAAYADAS